MTDSCRVQLELRSHDAPRDGALRQPGLLPHGGRAGRGAASARRPQRPTFAFEPAGAAVPLRG